MSLILERNETQSLIRLEGDCHIGGATELKTTLLESLAPGTDVIVDLTEAGDLDICTLQLLWAAEREAVRAGSIFSTRMSETGGVAAVEAGFQMYLAGARE